MNAWKKEQTVTFNGVDYERSAEIEAYLSEEPAGLGVNISDRVQWEALKKKAHLQEYQEDAEKYLDVAAVQVSDDNYLEVSKTGERRNNDLVSEAQAKEVRYLCIAECAEDSGRYLKKYEEAIRTICSQKSWSLSVHDNGFDTFYGRDMYIDLRVAVLGWELATFDYLLGNRVSEEVRLLLRENMERRIFAPIKQIIKGEKAPYFWMTAESNWNVVCLAGCIGAALTMIKDKKERALFARAFEKLVGNGMSCYQEDGYCVEEIGYWGYGFSHFLSGMEMIRRSTGGKLDMFYEPGVKESCLFGLNSEITDNTFACVGDTSFGAKAYPVNVRYVCNRLGIENRCSFNNTEVGSKQTEYLYQLLIFWFWDPAATGQIAATTAAMDMGRGLRSNYDSMQVLICRPKEGQHLRMGAFFKGGDNHQPHNHLDVGNYVVEVNGETLIADCGHPKYNAKTFSEFRYDVRALNSYGHNVPVVGGYGQRGTMGEDMNGNPLRCAGKVLKKDLSEERDSITYDIKMAYQKPFVEELKRTFTYERKGDGRITVTDYFAFTQPESFETALITYSKAAYYDNTIYLYGETYGVRVELPSMSCIIKIDSLEPCLKAESKKEEQPVRIGIQLPNKVQTGEFTVAITPFLVDEQEIL